MIQDNNFKNLSMSFLGEITFNFCETYYYTVLGISKIEDNSFEEDYVFLSLEEKEELKKLRRKQVDNFLVGRFAVKNIVQHILNLEQIECSKFSVKNKKSGEPYIFGTDFQHMKVSIAHSGKYGLAMVFPNDIEIGVDLEKKIVDVKEKRMFINKEDINVKYEFDTNSDFKENEIYTIIWSAKEALSKCLKTGLINNINRYDILNINICKDYVWGNFKNYSSYKFIGFKYNCYVVSIVYPKNMKLCCFKKVL